MQTNLMDNLAMFTNATPFIAELAQLLQVHSAGHFSQQPDHETSRKVASDYLLIWVLGGKGFGKTRSRRVEVTAGQLLSFSIDKSHAYGSDTQNSLQKSVDLPQSFNVLSPFLSHAK